MWHRSANNRVIRCKEMKWKEVLIPLLLWTVVHHINIVMYQSDASAGSKTSSSALKTWFKLLSGWIHRPTTINNNIIQSSSLIESSFAPDEELILVINSFNLRQSTDSCTCFTSGSCSVTCTSLESHCGRVCTITSEFYAFYKTYTITVTNSYHATVSYAYATKTLSTRSYISYSTGCEEVLAECTATSEVAAVAAVVYETYETDTYTIYSPPDNTYYTSSTPSTASNFGYSTECEQVTEGCSTTAVEVAETEGAVTIELYETDTDTYHSTAVNTYYPLSTSSTPNHYGYTGCEQGTEGCTAIAVEVAEAVVAIITNTAVNTDNTPSTTSYNTGSTQVTTGYTGTALTALVVILIAVSAVAIAVGVALPTAEVFWNQTDEIQVEVEQFISNGELFDTLLMPVNDLPIPVPGKNLQDDGCGYSSIRFKDGRCYPLLKRGPCSNPYFWVTLDPVRLTVI